MKNMYFFLSSLLYLLLSLFVRRNSKYIAFGSWNGKEYLDNSRYLAEKASDILDSSFSLFWIGETTIEKQVSQNTRIKFIKKNTLKANFILLRCKYMFCSQFPSNDFSNSNVFRNAVIIYLHHGFPIKRWGQDVIGYNEENISIIKKIYRKVIPNSIKLDYFTVSSKSQAENFLTALKDRGCRSTNIWNYGTPRNDLLLNASKDYIQSLKVYYSSLYGFDIEKKVILYLPTYRNLCSVESIFYRKNACEKITLKKILCENNAIMMEKNHFAERGIIHSKTNTKEYIYLDSHANVQELMLIADILISDYSGALVDYLLLNRPIIHYIYDYEYYKNIDTGLYYDITEFQFGEIAYTYYELLEELKSILNGEDKFEAIRQDKKINFAEFEKGDSAEKIINIVRLL